jgi:ribosomal protein S18 acetylase RimI-like enzyme
MNVQTKIRRAVLDDLEPLSVLFNGYRSFYGVTNQFDLSRQFVNDRLTQKDSIIFIAQEQQSFSFLGFVQLYPSFSSIKARRVWILNDLFVSDSVRGVGVGKKLIYQALEFAKSDGACRLVLETNADNIVAQSLYLKMGFVKEETFLTYYYLLDV